MLFAIKKAIESTQKPMATPIRTVNSKPVENTTVPSVYLFFGLSVPKSPVGEGSHLFNLFFLSVQHLAQVHNHLSRGHRATLLDMCSLSVFLLSKQKIKGMGL